MRGQYQSKTTRSHDFPDVKSGDRRENEETGGMKKDTAEEQKQVWMRIYEWMDASVRGVKQE